jgi:hypothetical protein
MMETPQNALDQRVRNATGFEAITMREAEELTREALRRYKPIAPITNREDFMRQAPDKG